MVRYIPPGGVQALLDTYEAHAERYVGDKATAQLVVDYGVLLEHYQTLVFQLQKIQRHCWSQVDLNGPHAQVDAITVATRLDGLVE